jgi:hypothetical protein
MSVILRYIIGQRLDDRPSGGSFSPSSTRLDALPRLTDTSKSALGRIHAAQQEGVSQSPQKAAMGEEKLSALNEPVKENSVQNPSQRATEADSPAIPGFNAPIPTAIPKPKLPLPALPSTSSKSDPTMKETPAITKRDWNTSKLGLRVGVDAVSAGAAGALVAPIITMIDKGIIENASGRNTLGGSLKQSAREMLLRPHRFITSKPFVLIFVRL